MDSGAVSASGRIRCSGAGDRGERGAQSGPKRTFIVCSVDSVYELHSTLQSSFFRGLFNEV